MQLPASLDAFYQLLEASIAGLEGKYERLPFSDYPAWWQPEAQEAIRWFGGPGVLLREDSRTWLWALARNAAGRLARGVRSGLARRSAQVRNARWVIVAVRTEGRRFHLAAPSL